MATSASPASSPGNSRYGSALDHGPDDRSIDHHAMPDSIPVEALVDHLLAAKRSLSSMTLVLRANDLSTHARQLHEEAVIASAQTAFLKKGIRDQVKLLMRVRRSLIRTYDAGKRDFKQIPKTLDAANGKLEAVMDMLRNTTVDPVFRPAGEEPKNLLDFVDETKVEKLRDALKASIGELQVSQGLALGYSVLKLTPIPSPGYPDFFRRRPFPTRKRPPSPREDPVSSHFRFVPAQVAGRFRERGPQSGQHARTTRLPDRPIALHGTASFHAYASL